MIPMMQQQDASRAADVSKQLTDISSFPRSTHDVQQTIRLNSNIGSCSIILITLQPVTSEMQMHTHTHSGWPLAQKLQLLYISAVSIRL